MTDPYKELGLGKTASKEEVKESFRKLCMEHHPDKCAPALKPNAEMKFRKIKDAYDAILRGQAGYAPPPPGTSPSATAAKAWSQAHGWGDGFGPARPPRPMNGPYGGYKTELLFYQAMFKNSHNNPMLLIAIGIISVPLISMMVGGVNGKQSEFFKRLREEGIEMFADNRWSVNGKVTTNNPFAIRDSRDRSSYIYKSEKYKHLRAEMGAEEGGDSAPSTATSGAV